MSVQDNPDDWAVVQAMEIYGGGFVKALASAFMKADHENFEKLKKAFPEYWSQYSEISKRRG